MANSGYYYGLGVEEDLSEAFRLFQLAAEKNQVNAQYSLGYMYENGDGIEKDMEKALYWYKLAANQGKEEAKERITELER